VVVHHEPVRIPISALPPRLAPAGSRFSRTFVIGTAGALWFAAAAIIRDPVAVTFATAWGVALLVVFAHDLRR
jgi:hypothetical protein